MKISGAWLLFPLFAAPAPAKHVPVVRGPLLMLPSISNVRIDVRDDGVVVEQNILLPQGDWHGGDIVFCSAFGAPSIPIAIDAKLRAVEDGALEAGDRAIAEPLAVDVVANCPSDGHLLLGPPKMAGALLRLREAALRKAFSPGKMAEIRIRSKVPMPRANEVEERDLVVRLGMHEAAPLTLGRVSIDASSPTKSIVFAEAKLCGPQADSYPLAVQFKGRPPNLLVGGRAPLAPVLAVRHASDDLCLRFKVAASHRSTN